MQRRAGWRLQSWQSWWPRSAVCWPLILARPTVRFAILSTSNPAPPSPPHAGSSHPPPHRPQTAAGFLAFMAVLNDYGYSWSTLPGLGINWTNYPMICSLGTNSYGLGPRECGFGCGEPEVGPRPGSPGRCSAVAWQVTRVLQCGCVAGHLGAECDCVAGLEPAV